MGKGYKVTVGVFLLVGLPSRGLAEQLSDSERRSAFIGYSESSIPEPGVPSVLRRRNYRREGPLEGSWKWASKEYLASEQLKNRTEPILLSKEPCVLLLPNFVDPISARQMMKMAEPRLRSQQFRDQPDTRTSWGAVLWGNDRVAGEAVRKSEELVRAARSDGLEVKRYQVGEKYNSHHDYFSSPQSQMKDDRIATFLIYLQTAEEGGETIFPWAGGTEQIDPRTGWPYRPLDYNTECEPQTTPPGAVKVMVPTGYAVLFYNAKKNGESDPYSQHGSCPVKRGEKWTATVWTRGANRFDPNDRWKTADVLAMCDP